MSGGGGHDGVRTGEAGAPPLLVALDRRLEPVYHGAEPIRERRPGCADRRAGSRLSVGIDRLVRGYVDGARAARRLARDSGLLARLERNLDRRAMLLARSLFAVHDIDDLARFDLAWWTFGALRRVDAFLAARGGGGVAFEYGPGASTLWLARRCRRVAAVEHDPAWWPVLARRLDVLPNVEARHVPGARPRRSGAAAPSGQRGWTHLDFSAYVAAIRGAGGPFDLIVIDGRARASCLVEALGHLKPDGLILFDDAHRRRYRAALAASGLRISRHRGLAPTSPWPSETALLAWGPAAFGAK